MKMISNFLASRDLQGGGLYLATTDGVVVANSISIRNVELNDNRSFPFGGLSCNSVDKITPDSDLSSVVEFSGNKYELYCSTISLAGVPSVYTLAFPYYGLLGAIHKSNQRVMILLIMTVIVVAAFVASFMSLAVKSTREKMKLNAQLIKQMESTQQAEKKTISKSMAIATASHDIRASLSAIIGLIELCYHDVTPGSELKESLNQMSSCASDLVALLNSILDTSKIEAGKMQLHETEFNMAQLLEDLADLYHPVGMKKGVDVVLDPCDGSVYTFSNVRGDYGKLKQILSNLLSNAVKFTKEGHVSIRAWARKFIFENSVMEDSKAKTTFSCSTCFFPGQVQHVDADLQDLTRLIKTNPNCIEFVFEVDDTGVGIPKEKRRTVFENYEQVKEAVAEVGGTGLGLGIVRSLVQLMGGDIEIMDKSSYKGTCFRFNIFLVACDNGMKTFPIPNIATLPGHYHNICNDTIGSSRRAIAPPRGPDNTDSSLVVLLIQNKGRRKMIQKFLETRGLGVMVAKEAKFLPSILKKVKHKLIGSSFHSSSDLSPRLCFSSSSSTRREDTKSVPLTTLDGSYETPSILQGRPNLSGISCVMLIIDANVGEFSVLSRIISDLKKNIDRSKSCKVVWLEKPETLNLHFQRNNEKTVASSDEIFIKPLHGSRLFQVIGHLPEFGGQLTEASPKWKRNNTMEVGSALDPDGIGQKLKSKVSLVSVRTYQGEIEEIGNSSSGRSSAGQKKSIALLATSKGLTGNRLTEDDNYTRKERSAASKQIETALIVQTNMSSASSTSSQNPLHGKKILIADDDKLQKRIATMTLSKMGATLVETCNNGKEALELVCKSLRDQALQGSVEPLLIIASSWIVRCLRWMDLKQQGESGLRKQSMIFASPSLH